MDINYAAIGARINRWRTRKQLTQEQLAVLADNNPSYISRIEHGKQKPSLRVLLQICQAMDLDINNLLSDSPKSYSFARLREFEFLLDGCNDSEISIILQNAAALKNILKSIEKKP